MTSPQETKRLSNAKDETLTLMHSFTTADSVRRRTLSTWIVYPALVLAFGLSLDAGAVPVPTPPHSGASATCTGRVTAPPHDAGRTSSKLRHAPDEDDPCDDSIGRGRAFTRLHPIAVRPAASAVSSDDQDNKLGTYKP